MSEEQTKIRGIMKTEILIEGQLTVILDETHEVRIKLDERGFKFFMAAFDCGAPIWVGIQKGEKQESKNE